MDLYFFFTPLLSRISRKASCTCGSLAHFRNPPSNFLSQLNPPPGNTQKTPRRAGGEIRATFNQYGQFLREEDACFLFHLDS